MLTQTQVLKDIDFVTISNFSECRNLVNVSMEDRRNIISALKMDAEFLCSMGLMDYSLLLGVEVQEDQSEQGVKTRKESLSEMNDQGFKMITGHYEKGQTVKVTKRQSSFRINMTTSNNLIARRKRTTVKKILSVCGKFIYHISIIDYLQKYTIHKRLERYAKMLFVIGPRNGKHLSAINQTRYKERFIEFCKKVVFSNI